MCEISKHTEAEMHELKQQVKFNSEVKDMYQHPCQVLSSYIDIASNISEHHFHTCVEVLNKVQKSDVQNSKH